MKIIKAKEEHLDEIMKIVEEAKIELGLLTKCQWQFGYPNRDTFINDIKNGDLYVGVIDDEVVAVSCYISGAEPTYENIYNGNWINNSDYLTIHRLAIKGDCKHCGYAKLMINYGRAICYEKKLKSIRVDTHASNVPMNNLLINLGFEYVGEIYVDDVHDYNSHRLAYELVL